MTRRPSRTVAAQGVQPYGYPRARPFDPAEWPGETVRERAQAYARALLPPSPERLQFAGHTVAAWARSGHPAPYPVPPFASAATDPLRVLVDAFRYIRDHGLSVVARDVAREWWTAHPDSAPPTEREQFGF